MTRKSKFALQARWVVPLDGPPVAGGVVTIDGQHITAVGTRAVEGAAVDDLGDVVLLPGLVNAHTHLEFSQLHQPLGQPGISLPDWVRLVITQRNQSTDRTSELTAGLHESLQTGVTSIGEISTMPLPVDELSVLPELVAYHEVIGFSAERVESVYADLQQQLPAGDIAYQPGISPHAPYTVHPELLKKLITLSHERQLPVAMHLAESREELQLLCDNQGPFRELLDERSMWDENVFAAGRQPLEYLHLLAQAPRALVVHGNYLSRREIAFVAEHRRRMSIVFCPRTHTYFEHDEYPLSFMLEAGVCVAVGTDSRASSPDLRLLEELRHVARTYPNISPDVILSLGTINGAAALGTAAAVGSLAAGKLANLTAVACDRAEQSPVAALLHGDAQPHQTWLRGMQV